MNYNKATIIGKLTADPEKRTIPSTGSSVVNFSVATSHIYNNKEGVRKEDTEFHNVVAFDRTADNICNYLTKGSLVFVEGRLRTRSWEDKNDGSKKYRTEIYAERVIFGPKNANAGSNEEKPPQKSENSNQKEIPIINEDDDIDVKDIPF